MEPEKQTIIDNLNLEGASVEYIKLIKNTKGYSWEIKLLSLNPDEIEKLNQQMVEKFGEQI